MSTSGDRFRVAAFDLDGTLVDSTPDLAAAANAMLEALGLAPLPEHRIAQFIGDGVDMLILRAIFYSTGDTPSPSLLRAASETFRQRYGEGVFERGRVYPGVVEGLTAIRARSIPSCCITNKHSAFTLPLIAAAGLAELLDLVLCADQPKQRKPAPALLLAACARLGVPVEQMLYVGDSPLDIAAARAAGCPVALVTYGYGTDRQLSIDDPDWSIGSLAEVASLVAGEQPARALR